MCGRTLCGRASGVGNIEQRGDEEVWLRLVENFLDAEAIELGAAEDARIQRSVFEVSAQQVEQLYADLLLA